MFSRRIGAVACALGMSVALSACGSSGNSYKPLTKATFAKAISEAASKSTSVHMAATSTTSSLTESADYILSGAGAAQVTLVAKVGTNSSTIVFRIVGSDAYALEPSGPQKGKWAKIPSGLVGSEGGGFSPKSLASTYEKSAQSITYIGTANVNGQASRHYRVILPVSSLATSGTSLAALAPSLAGAKTITQEVYLSDKNLLQRIVVDYPSPIGPMQADFTKWNQVAPIKAPSASELVPIGKK